MTTTKTTLQSVSASVSPEVQMNENFQALSAAAIFGYRAPGASALTWAFFGGIYGGNNIDDGTVALTDNATNYVVVLRSTGVVSVSTATTNWNSTLYARLYKVTTASGAVTATEDHRFDSNGLLYGAARWIPVACGDESTAITTGTAKVTFRWQGAFSLLAVRGSLTTAQTSGSLLTVDIKKNGTSIFTTLITFDNTEKTTLTAATAAVLTATPLAIADDDEITIDVTQVGAGTPAGLKLYFRGAQS
jgi:hypothetical protein